LDEWIDPANCSFNPYHGFFGALFRKGVDGGPVVEGDCSFPRGVESASEMYVELVLGKAASRLESCQPPPFAASDKKAAAGSKSAVVTPLALKRIPA